MQHVYFIRYSCSDFSEEKSSRVTSIQISSSDPEFEIRNFSFDREAEVLFSNRSFRDLISSELDLIEKSLIKSFNALMREVLLPQNSLWYHWQMEDNGQYGFECLRHRGKLLFGEEFYLSIPKPGKRQCLKVHIKQKKLPKFPDLGNNGRSLEILAEYFGISTHNLLHGKYEAECFKLGDWKKVSASGLAKIRIMKELYVSVETPSKVEETPRENAGFIKWFAKHKDEIAAVNHLSSVGERFLKIAWVHKIWIWAITFFHL